MFLQQHQKKKAKPDLYYEDDKVIRILDPKYKFDYDEPSYFDIPDLERMFKYIASSESKNEIPKMKQAIFLFPTIKNNTKNPLNGNKYLLKECITIPQKEGSILNWASTM